VAPRAQIIRNLFLFPAHPCSLFPDPCFLIPVPFPCSLFLIPDPFLPCPPPHFPLRASAPIRMIRSSRGPQTPVPSEPTNGNRSHPKRRTFLCSISMRQLLDEAAKGGYGVGAQRQRYGTDSGIMAAARKQVARSSRPAAGSQLPRIFTSSSSSGRAELNPDIPIAMHQDHGNSLRHARAPLPSLHLVMMDGSLKPTARTPSTFEENVEVTRKVVDYAHERGVTVEGEIGVLAALKTARSRPAAVLTTSPTPTRLSISPTHRRYALAIAIGTSHGAIQVHQEARRLGLKMDVLTATTSVCPTPTCHARQLLVPKDLQTSSTSMRQAQGNWGVPVEEIQLGIATASEKST